MQADDAMTLPVLVSLSSTDPSSLWLHFHNFFVEISCKFRVRKTISPPLEPQAGLNVSSLSNWKSSAKQEKFSTRRPAVSLAARSSTGFFGYTSYTDTKALSLREIPKEVVIFSLNLGLRPNLFFQTPFILHDRFPFPTEGCCIVLCSEDWWWWCGGGVADDDE